MQSLDIDKLIQITTYGKTPTDARNHPLMPQHYGGLGSFRMLVSGRAGRGKTQLIISAIMQGWIRFDHLYIYVRDPTQPKYQLLIKWLNTMCDLMAEEGLKLQQKIYTVVSDPTKIVSVDKLNPDIINLAIFDDMLIEKNQEKILEYFIRGRHRSVDSIYLTQSYHLTDSTLRKNCDYFAIFGVSSKSELTELTKSLSLRYDAKEFKEILTKATEGPNDFLFIDTRTKNRLLELRKGFDSFWDEETHQFEKIDPDVLKQLS